MTEGRPLEQRIYDGDQAKEVLANPAFAQAFEDIKQEYINVWMNSPARDEEAREKLYLMVRLTCKLEETLKGMMADGKMARVQVEYEADRLAKDRAAGLGVYS